LTSDFGRRSEFMGQVCLKGVCDKESRESDHPGPSLSDAEKSSPSGAAPALSQPSAGDVEAQKGALRTDADSVVDWQPQEVCGAAVVAARGDGPPLLSYFGGTDVEELEVLRAADASPPRSGARHLFSKSGASYTGQWDGFRRDGAGAQAWPDGAVYSGEWRANLAAGRGRFRSPSGDEFVGEWRSGKAHGRGVYRTSAGVTYEGLWEDDQPHGLGVERWPDGSQYSGDFLGGRGKDGFGVFRRGADGEEFAGEFRADEIVGKGRHTAADGKQVAGEWQNGNVHGRGRYEWIDNQIYSGQFVNDCRHGFGSIAWKDDIKFQGWWHNDLQHGYGRLALAGGVTEGQWREGVRILA